MPFDPNLRTRIVFGTDAVDRVGELVAELAAERVFLVTDPGIVAAGHVERVETVLRACQLEVRRFDAVRQNPTTVDVENCVADLGDWNVDLLVGLGGGSSIDVAKGCAFLRAGGGRMQDYWGIGKARGTLLPVIAIPTTAGTGSEVQSFALISQEESHQKMACGDPQAAPRLAILDPTLSVTQPRFVTACTGLDAIVHAVETAVTTKRTRVSDQYSRQAFQLGNANLAIVLEEPDNLEARGEMLVAAACAGIAIENSMLGAAHSMASPLTAHHGFAHGQAVGMMLPIVVRYNSSLPEARSRYAALARASGLCPSDAADGDATESLIARLLALLEVAGFERSLASCGVTADAVDDLAAEAARQWTANFNPSKVDEADFRDLFAIACGA